MAVRGIRATGLGIDGIMSILLAGLLAGALLAWATGFGDDTWWWVITMAIMAFVVLLVWAMTKVMALGWLSLFLISMIFGAVVVTIPLGFGG